jgi:hypothetical protein
MTARARKKHHSDKTDSDRAMLEQIQTESFGYFLKYSNKKTGLVADSSREGSYASVAAVGFALASYVVAVERGLLKRSLAVSRILRTLRFLYKSPQSSKADASGFKGFYYHFLDMKTGQRSGSSELSTIDTSLFIAGALTAASYFSGSTRAEKELRHIATKLYHRIDWVWALNGGPTLSHGWKPDSGFLPLRWSNHYCEAILMYVLAMGSPTHPIPALGYTEWTKTFEFRKLYGIEYFHAAPLFIHQFSQTWIDFRGIRDAVNRKHNLDYFENSRRATMAQQAYAISNPLSFDYYGRNCWGLSASQGPGEKSLEINGIKRNFHGYFARGAPDGVDDGTVSPWAVVASLPFTPDIVLESTRYFIEKYKLKERTIDGFEASFNFCYPDKSQNRLGWVAPDRLGINQGPMVLMIENYFSELIWKNFKKCDGVKQGLRAAGFTGGWLNGKI